MQHGEIHSRQILHARLARRSSATLSRIDFAVEPCEFLFNNKGGWCTDHREREIRSYTFANVGHFTDMQERTTVMIRSQNHLTLIDLLLDASPVVQLIVAGIGLILLAALVTWLSCLWFRTHHHGARLLGVFGIAAPLSGFAGAAYGQLNSPGGIVGAGPSQTLMAFACVMLGLAVGSIVSVLRGHIRNRAG